MNNDTKIKIFELLKLGESFITQNYESDLKPDLMFILNAFDKKFSLIKSEISTSKFDMDKYHDSIYDFDNILSTWFDNLSYKMDNDDGNSHYIVLFAVLQGIDNIINEG